MAQGALIRAAAAALVLALGIAAERVAPSASAALAVADLAVGAVLGCGGAWLLERAPVPALLALAAAVTWFLGTLAAAPGAVGTLGSAFLLVHRAPILQLLLGIPGGVLGSRSSRVLAGGAWIAAILPVAVAGPATAAAGALVAVATGHRARGSALDRRWALTAASLIAAALSALWTLAALDAGAATLLLVLDDAAVLAAGTLALCAAAGVFARRAANALVVDLGPTRPPGLPITAQLGRALADPGLQLLYAVPGLGWMDERGRPSPPPERDESLVTRASAPGGGTVALVHSDDGAFDARLAESAAAAAALALDAAHLEAEIRARSEEVRVSRRRLLTVADAERRSLEERLADGVLAPLRRVDRLLASRRVDGLAAVREELDGALADVAALGHGLYPPALARADLPAALADLAARCTIPAAVTVHGAIGHLPDAQRAAAWFVCAEALTNAARHAGASRATVGVRVHADTLRLEIRDDGTGGATLTRGLRGLADRIEALGGTVTVTSPLGGPTSICADLPL